VTDVLHHVPGVILNGNQTRSAWVAVRSLAKRPFVHRAVQDQCEQAAMNGHPLAVAGMVFLWVMAVSSISCSWAPNPTRRPGKAAARLRDRPRPRVGRPPGDRRHRRHG
jgi:hypothetical protein